MAIRALAFALALWALLFAFDASARTHTVAKGHTLGKIAKRYHVSIEALAKANGIGRRDPLKPGTKLVIPDASDDESGSDDEQAKSDPSDKRKGKHDKAAVDAGDESADADDADKPEKSGKSQSNDDDVGGATRSFGSDGLRVLEVPGHGDAYYYEPVGAGRKGMKPVVMYLHGRGGNPMRDCRRWAPVARRFGWLVCPSGPNPHGDGRDWNNNWASGQQIALATLKALRKHYKRRVQLAGNTLIGFSEGAYVALNVGVREARTFNRWLILAGNTSYWGGAGLEELKKSARELKRVYLITGEQDSVIEGTHQLEDWLQKAKVSVRVSTPKDMGHEVALDRKPGMYRAALHWLERGAGKRDAKKASSTAAPSSRTRR
jgi:predicted esterase/LysM repeat protein